jgi:hypothetical protein
MTQERAPERERSLVGEVWDDFLGGGTRPSRESRGTENELARDDASGRSAAPDARDRIWIDGAIHIVAGEGTRKARNLASDGRCVIATSSTTLPSLDIVVECRADPLIEGDAVGHIADVLSASGWPLEAASSACTGWISSIGQICRDRPAGASAAADLDVPLPDPSTLI